ncbi:MAG: hypothetical protein KDA69_03095 [Planctomycetaceae bacterium]|nr:hypothetical protein [Planctomycetaceae bacterium]MCA9043277.1 hypothetical protein [Planctomycetaceae bacterium]MCB9950727.1 hypothetical protein [Planctomycetaceae bacterium]
MRVQIRLADLSLFPGVRELLIAGHRSSLDMANYRLLVEDSSIKEVAEYQSGRVANSDLVKF